MLWIGSVFEHEMLIDGLSLQQLIKCFASGGFVPGLFKQLGSHLETSREVFRT